MSYGPFLYKDWNKRQPQIVAEGDDDDPVM